MGHEDWDLFAIVRSCQAATFTATPTTETPPTTTTTNTRPSQDTSSSLATFTDNQENGPFSFPNLVQPRTNGFQELHQLFMTFKPTTTSISGRGITPDSSFSDLAGSIGQQHRQQRHHHPVLASTTYTSIGASTSGFGRFHDQQQQQPQQHVQQPQHPQRHQQQRNQLQVQVPQTETSSMVLPSTQSQTPRSRKRKSQQKKMVCRVTADNLSADLWAWRKYGQKPIKGSPHPRNYYKCSSCKGCAARKQVERSTTEPDMFIVTYTGDHKHAKPVHRNSLAGSTRNKPSTTSLPATGETGSPSNVGNSSCSVFSPTLSRTVPPENDDAVDDLTSAGEPDGADPDPEPDMASDNDEVLIPNTSAMSDAVFLGLQHFDGGSGDDSICFKPPDGSDPNSAPGLTPACSEPSSNNSRPNPG